MKQRKENRSEPCSNDETEQRIQRRAYELYSQRGQQPGKEIEDWLQAEREVRHLAQSAPSHAMEINA